MTGTGLHLTIVGASAAWSRRIGESSSCYLVELNGQGLVLDLGQGSFAALSSRRDPETLRAVLISHLHPDHGIDLIALRHYLRFACDPPRSVELHAPADLRRRYDVLLGERDFLAPLPGEPLAAGRLDLAPFEVTVSPVTHLEPSFAFRIARAETHGAGLVYSGDCGRADDLLTLLRPGDTLLCEAYFGSEPAVREARHLTSAEAARVARAGQAARLILTHLKDGTDQAKALAAAKEVFGGETLLARSGASFTID